jgi:hypothetical protein
MPISKDHASNVSSNGQPKGPLRIPQPPARLALDSRAFQGPAGELVRRIEPHSEADPVALLVQVLTAAGNIIGRGAYWEVEDVRHYPNLFVALVGDTGTARKGTSWGRVEAFFKQFEPDWVANNVASSGLTSGEGVIWRIRDAVSKRERVKEPGQPATYQTVEADPGVSDKRLLCYEPELASAFSAQARDGNNLSATLRNAWDGRTLSRMRSGFEIRATDPHVSLIGHITPEERRRTLSATEQANGYGNRFLWVYTQRSKFLPRGDSLDPAALSDLKALSPRPSPPPRTAAWSISAAPPPSSGISKTPS